MRKLVRLFVILVLFVSCENQNKEGERLDANTIINKAINAYGGKAKLRNIKTKIENGVNLIFINDSLFKSNQFLSLKKEGGKHYYQSPAYQKKYGQKLVFASNGSYSWTQNDGAFAPYMQPQEEHINQGGEDYPYLFNLDERGVKTEYIESFFEQNEKLHRVDYTSKEGVTEEVYFVDNLWLIRKTRRFIETSQGTAEMIRYFQDYRDINNVMIPFRSESYFPPREKNINLLNSITINESIPDNKFEFPEPKKLTKSEINQFTGTYYNKENKVTISEKDSKLFIQYDDQPKIELTIVDQNLLMYRDGIGGGSRMANILLRNGTNERFIEITLRKQTSKWLKQ
ncbi:hypothetical protein [Pontimicrobium aquaticum]|uniref:Outer membrane lipoprotein-sorting protein n=1 Tax=Pontimicrobium aquaticum TaxID=2565367 RepID=A0A4U0F4M7_9FLAO|nr:hypothetical protein [Pontimicrobium aquaticum]TJY37752.1 hypothetical protein E5167_00430 [Pontimicrobium aquaticum]